MRSRVLPLVALLLCAGVFFIGLSASTGLHQNDEDFYLAVASNMLESGDWVVPHWSGQPTFTKPPLLYWLIAASMRVFGSTLLAGRLPVALLAVLTIAAVLGLGRRVLESDAHAALAALLTGTTIGFLQFGRVGMMEVPLCFFYLCATWAAWRIGQGSARACYGFAVAATGSVLLKGPATALVPLLGAFIWIGAGRRRDPGRADLPWLHIGGGLLLFLAMVGAWPLAVHQRGLYDAFYAEFVVGENMGKFVGDRGPVLGMLGGYGALLIPWTLLVVGALWTWVRGGGEGSPAVVRLCLSFVMANLIFYSLPAVKWARYLLPSTPLLALLLADVGVRRPFGDESAPDRTEVGLAGVFAPLRVSPAVKCGAVITGAVFLLVVPLLAIGSRLFPDMLTRVEILVLSLALAVCALCLVHGTRLFGAAASFAVVLVTVIALTPALTFDRPPAEIARLANGLEAMTYDVPPYRYELIMGRKVGSLRLPEEVRQFARRGGGVIFVGNSELRELMDKGAFDPSKAEMLTSWTKWRRGMNVLLVTEVIVSGKLDDLTETVWMMRVR